MAKKITIFRQKTVIFFFVYINAQNIGILCISLHLNPEFTIKSVFLGGSKFDRQVQCNKLQWLSLVINKDLLLK